MRTGCIYIFKNQINGKMYIGQSVNPTMRYKAHIWAATRKENGALYKAINKYGINNFMYGIAVDNIQQSKLDVYEIAFIASYNTYNNGYNSTLGGAATAGWTPSVSTRQVMSQNNTGGKNPTAKKIINLRTLEVYSCCKFLADVIGVCQMTITTAIKKRHRINGDYWCLLSEMELPFVEIPKNKLCFTNKPKVIVNLNTSQVYCSMREAERQTGIARQSIANSIKTGNLGGGYKWDVQ